MSDISKVIAETQMDFKDPKLIENFVAPAIADRLRTVVPEFADAVKGVTTMVKTLTNIAAATTVLGAVGAAAAAVALLKDWFDGKVNASYSDQVTTLQDTRNKFVERYYGLYGTGWSTALRSMVAPKVPDVKNQAGGWSEADFLAQYEPYYIWMVEKVGRNVIAPTWPTPPMDSPASVPEYWCGGFKPFGKSPLSGYAIEFAGLSPNFQAVPSNHPDFISALARRRFRSVQPPVPAMSDCDAFWGNAPGSGTQFENKIDTAVFTSGYGIPPGYEYLFSWGTYPYLAWGTSSNGLVNGAKYALSSAAAAVAAGIHSPTIVHCGVDAAQVAACYRQWLEVTKIRELPPQPEKQVEEGVYLDKFNLPWSPSDFLFVPRGPNNVFYPVPWRVARDIELSFRSFFKVRRALLFQLDKATESVRKAAAASPDLALRAAVKHGAPPYRAWTEADPLGDGWRTPVMQGIPVDPKTKPGNGGGVKPGMDIDFGSVDSAKDPTAAILVGLAVGAWAWWKTR